MILCKLLFKKIEKILGTDGNKRSIGDLKKDYPNEIEKLEEAIINYMEENDLKILNTESPDKWKSLTK